MRHTKVNSLVLASKPQRKNKILVNALVLHLKWPESVILVLT